MAAFIRSKQSGMQTDLSASILPGLFTIDDEARYGINSQISTFAYDPVQSLLAVGTNESQYGSGQIYIFGRDRVQVTIKLSRRASVKELRFCADKLLSLDTKNELTVWDLIGGGKKICSYTAPGIVTCLATDPMLDWAFLGLQQGEIVAFDLDRERAAPLRLPNFFRERSPRSRILSVVSLQLHPRDIGQLLIGYTEGAVIYSFKEAKATKFFQYEVPPGAPGGASDPNVVGDARRPRLTQCLWHPTGTFVLTAHEDGSLVFWDPKDGRVVMARTLDDLHVDQPGSKPGGSKGGLSIKEPYAKISWCAKTNPDDTGLLIAGGVPMSAQTKGLTFLELGPTPVYATSSWQTLTDHFKGKQQKLLETPAGAEVIDYCLIPRASPHFDGAQDPIAVIALLSSGELITLSFPSGHPISPTNQLHPSLTFVHPFVVSCSVTTVNRTRWLGMTEKRQQGPPLLRGGVGGSKNVRKHEDRTIIQTAHGDGTVRIWDAGTSDKLENSGVLQIDVARSLGRYENIEITAINMAGQTGEMAVGTKSGEVAIYRWGGNKLKGFEPSPPVAVRPGTIENISDRAEPGLREGLQPFVLYNMAHGPISALKMSDVGFIGVGSEDGTFAIIDLRGPAIIFDGSVNDFAKHEKKGSLFNRSSSHGGPKTDWAVSIAFGVLTLDNDEYSSICCFVGTNLGRVATFKILPQQNGGYTTQFAGVAQLNDRVVSICPIIATSGQPAVADGPTVASLREGRIIPGMLVVVTEAEVRVFKPATAKGAQKTWDDSTVMCHAASVTHFLLHGYAIVGVFGDGTARAYSIPALKELGVQNLPMLDKSRISSSIVTPSGDIFGWAGPSELAMLNAWGTGQPLARSDDRLFNIEALIPPRPTISNMQWISGTMYVSPTDLDLLIGGPDRPPSKRMMAAAAEEQRASNQARPGPSAKTEGWGDYMTRQFNERTEQLGVMGDTMERTQENSAGWADDASKFVSKQKRNLLFKSVAGKFF
ncbi:hypothetical protein V501_03070 [Pseudogymnoascus sp. VKM F-4519 (FW-2642)]|nr:hypothetical protein V501_03070 [Pseudogymnoascus sp. VKM F-4519 (FW-2642)]